MGTVPSGHSARSIQSIPEGVDQLSRPEVVEDQLPVLTPGAGDLLHGLNAGAHGLPAPFVEELASPGGRVVVPELLKRFFEKIRADGFQVVAEEVAEAEVLLVTKILVAFEQQPAG